MCKFFQVMIGVYVGSPLKNKFKNLSRKTHLFIYLFLSQVRRAIAECKIVAFPILRT